MKVTTREAITIFAAALLCSCGSCGPGSGAIPVGGDQDNEVELTDCPSGQIPVGTTVTIGVKVREDRGRVASVDVTPFSTFTVTQSPTGAHQANLHVTPLAAGEVELIISVLTDQGTELAGRCDFIAFDTHGACCRGTLCAVTSAEACTADGGAFSGSGTTCSETDCRVGACCHSNGTCTLANEDDCQEEGDSYAGLLTTCDEVFCEPAGVTGACCQGTNCASTVESQCPPDSGYFLASETCDAIICAAGACCTREGGCAILPEQQCVAPSTFLGVGELCTSEACKPPVGACCIGTICAETSEAECAGAYLGDGETCTSNLCNTITLSLAYDDEVVVDTEAGGMRVTWTGPIEFPVQLIWTPISGEQCPLGPTNCMGLSISVITTSTAIEWPQAPSCSSEGLSVEELPIEASYQLQLIDSAGRRSNIVETPFTCLPAL